MAIAVSFVDGSVFLTASAGLGPFVVASPSAGWRTPAQAGAVDGANYRYRAYSFDQAQWEIGTGVYTAATQTLSRDIILASSAAIPTDKMDFTAPPTVALTVQAEDLATGVSGFVKKTGDTMTGDLHLPPNGLLGVGAHNIRDDLANLRLVFDLNSIPTMWMDAGRFAPLPGKSVSLGDSSPTGGKFAHVYLAAGATIRWADSDVYMFHSTDKLDFYGAVNGYQFDAPVRHPDGTGPLPGVTFSQEQNSGLYRASPGIVRMVMGATTVQEYQTTNRATLFYGKATMVTADAAKASITLPHGVAPTTPVNGDMWTTTTALYARINGVTKQYPSLAEVDAAYLKLTGGTLTGDLKIQKSNAQLLLDKMLSGQYSALAGSVAGKLRWSLSLGNIDPETGGNAGSNFNFDRYDDDGNYLGTALNITRANGNMLTQGDLTFDKIDPRIVLNKKASEQAAYISATMQGAPRWILQMGNWEGEGGGNSGSNFVLYSYADNGAEIGEALRIQRATRAITAYGDLTLDPPADSPRIYMDKPVGAFNNIIWGRRNGQNRWAILPGDSTAESTGQAGSNFAINSYDDAGAYLATPVLISRNTGSVALQGNLSVNRAYPTVQLAATAGTSSQLLGTKGSLTRWVMDLGNGTAEGGSNAGSDFSLSRWNDAGAWLDNVLAIARATAAVTGSAIANSAAYWSNAVGKLITTTALWDAAFPVAVPYAASVTLNMSTGINFLINPISGALTLPNPTNIKSGQSGFIRLSGQNGQAITFGTAFYFPTGTKPTVMGAFNDMIWYQAVDSTNLFCSYVKSYTNA